MEHLLHTYECIPDCGPWSGAAMAFTPWFKLIVESFLFKWWDTLMSARDETGGKLNLSTLARLDSKEEREKIHRMV